jgi:hypothetical protein
MARVGSKRFRMNDSDRFWHDLLAFVKAGRVIPVIGDRAVTFGGGDELYSTYVASKLASADYLKLDPSRLPPVPTLTDVACEWLFSGGKSSELYKQCYFVTEEFERQAHTPGRGRQARAPV